MDGLASLLLNFGGPVLARALGRRFGSEVGDLAQDALDALGRAFGVEPTLEPVTQAVQQAASKDPEEAKARVRIAEADMAAVFAAQADVLRQANEQQRMTNELLQAQMREPGWRSDWLYVWQWFLMLAWTWTIFVVPAANAALRVSKAPPDAVIWSPDLGVLMTLTGLYLGLHMGGHTVLELVRNQWGGMFSGERGGKR